jgi:exopolysaccharide biosynthesis polyprenyl glycosylphosphotransferase
VVPPESAAALLDAAQVDEVWVEGFPSDRAVQEFLAAAATRGGTVRYVLPGNLLPGIRWEFRTFGDFTTATATRTPLDELALLTKSALDLVLSSLLLILALPFMALAALLILLQDGRPVIFRQQRLGLSGRPFTMYKFRTMAKDAEARLAGLLERNEMKGAAFKIRNDPRITPVGRWLRRFSIDELPQLFNVLKGDMSLVGPRPPLPEEVNLYEPAQRRRLSVRPGVTGYWQIRGRNQIADFDRWVELDLEYIDRWSLRLDLQILMRTIPAVLFMRGAR